MTEPKRILLVFGTRPEAIKLFPVVHALASAPGLTPITCVTAQHRELLDQVLAIGRITPDHDLDIMLPGQSLDGLTARLLTAIGEVIDEVQPDMVLVQGDTTSAMVGALCAYYRKLPVGHVEAGLRSGNIYHPWPEEVNRKIIGSIADLHFAPTQTSANALLAETVNPATVHVTGNTVIDALLTVADGLDADPATSAAVRPHIERFAGRRILGVTTHRRENFGGGLDNVADALAEIAQRNDIAIIFPVHPNPNVRGLMHGKLGGIDNIALVDPLDYTNFVALQRASYLMLTDSGGVQEEAPALGKPVLVMRETTERPEGVEAGTAKLVGTDRATIVAETMRLLDDSHAYAAMAKAHNPFGDGHSSERIAALITNWFAARAA
jgi:UDP-N-acetylglucosamine 2-epimerase (non-hydrolysing)